MSTRARVVEIASAEVGLSDAAKYWAGVGLHAPYPPHWCGGFALWCLRQAGLTDWDWVIGKGFLWRLRRTTDPQPGDIGYVDQPFQHHFVVEQADRHTIGSIDGNQGKPGVQRRSRAAGKHTYFSIASLLDADTRDTDPAPPLRATLRLGSSGDDVKALQAKLNSHGASLKVDGGFGPFTKLAVETFQRRGGLVVDGVVGSATWRLLEAV